MLFEPRDGFLTCPYCGHKEVIAESKERVEEQSFEQHLRLRPEQMAKLAVDALEVQCQSCGAKSIFTPPQVAGRCEFCGVQIVAQPKSADPIITPGALLPFCITQQQASSNLRQWLSSRWFAPNNLKRFAQPEAVTGIYLPFWTYDANTTTAYTGQRGEYYWETETYYERDSQGNQVQRTRQVRHTRWYSASGTVTGSFDDVLIPATASLPSDSWASASRARSTSSGWRMSRADREKSSGLVYPNSRTNDAFTRLNSPSKAMMDTGSIESSKNSSSSVAGCGTCGGLATSTRSFPSRDYP